MTLDPVVGALGLEIGKSAISNIIKKLVDLGEKHTLTKIEKMKNETLLETLYSKMSEIRKVKTIWQRERSIDLQTFYCPSNIVYNGTRIQINSLRDLPFRESFIVEGIAGQGKSILLRYLCNKEVDNSDSLPIFIELKNISVKESLLTHILRYLSMFGVEINEISFKEFAISKKITLFLDGYDELNETNYLEITNEIELLARTMPEIRIIISSRPNNSISNSSLFVLIKLDDLKNEEYKEIVQKIYTKEGATLLISEVEGNHKDTAGLLMTPLLVTLLVLYHKKNSRLPPQLSDYYESIFDYHHHIHDDNKVAFQRKRNTSLSDAEFRCAFTGFCF